MSIFAVLAMAPAAFGAPYPRTIVDSRGAQVAFVRAPQRIVSMTPGTTEILFAIGAGARVVGDTAYCNYPAAAAKLPKIGDSTPNYEKIVALRPDLVVVDDDAERNAVAQLNRLKIPIFVIHPSTYDRIESSVTMLGKVCGCEPQAANVIAGMEAKRTQARTTAATYSSHPPTVLVVVQTDPLWVAGRDTFFDDLLHLAGAANAAGSLASYAPESKELVLANPPDIILGSSSDEKALAKDPAFAALPAMRAHRFGVIEGDIFGRPGPRMGDALVVIAGTLGRLWASEGAH